MTHALALRARQVAARLRRVVSAGVVGEAANLGGGIRFEGPYGRWEDACEASAGYSDSTILERVSTAVTDVLEGRAAYEQDGVTFDEPSFSHAILAPLLHAASALGGSMRVMDVGGSLGSVFLQNRRYLEAIPQLDWAIVEQPGFVERGRALFGQGPPSFHVDLDECIQSIRPNIALLAGVLQYLPKPWDVLRRISESEISYCLISRTLLWSGHSTWLTTQIVPPSIYPGSYPAWIFDESELEREVSPWWQVVDRPEAAVAPLTVVDGTPVYCRGLYLERSA